MILIDKELFEQGPSLLSPFDSEAVTNIGYDLKTDRFFLNAQTSKTMVDLAPGDTVFVRTAETISLPNNMAAMVQLRNSRIRQGLSLTAPLYQPGHKTKVFFRITNATGQTIRLDTTKGLGTLVFIRLSDDVAKPYNGTFQNEEDYVGMGTYQSQLAEDVIELEKKVDTVKHIEKDLYSNVLSIMGIFVGIFSLINVNISLTASNASTAMLLTLNFATVGAIAFLIGLINIALTSDGNCKNRKWFFGTSAVAFAAAIISHIFL